MNWLTFERQIELAIFAAYGFAFAIAYLITH